MQSQGDGGEGRQHPNKFARLRAEALAAPAEEFSGTWNLTVLRCVGMCLRPVLNRTNCAQVGRTRPVSTSSLTLLLGVIFEQFRSPSRVSSVGRPNSTDLDQLRAILDPCLPRGWPDSAKFGRDRKCGEFLATLGRSLRTVGETCRSNLGQDCPRHGYFANLVKLLCDSAQSCSQTDQIPCSH